MQRFKLKNLNITGVLKKKRTVIISIVHGFFLLGLGYIWLGMTYTFGDEAFLIKWTALIKKEILNIDPKPQPREVLFINTSNSKTFVEVYDNPLSIKPGSVNITDRGQLAEQKLYPCRGPRGE